MSSARGCCEPSWSKTIHGRCVFPFPDPSSWVLFPSPSLGKERLQAASFLPHPWLSSRDVSQGECAQSPEVTEQLSRGLAKLLAFGVGFCLSFLFFLVAHCPHAPGPEVSPQQQQQQQPVMFARVQHQEWGVPSHPPPLRVLQLLAAARSRDFPSHGVFQDCCLQEPFSRCCPGVGALSSASGPCDKRLPLI